MCHSQEQRILAGHLLSKEAVVKAMEEQRAADVAEGLLLSRTSLAISLRCPISSARMKVSSGCYSRKLLNQVGGGSRYHNVVTT